MVYLVKMCPIFDCSQSNCLTSYQKILWVCTFECKNLLNFTCQTMKFLNCHHTNVQVLSQDLTVLCNLFSVPFQIPVSNHSSLNQFTYLFWCKWYSKIWYSLGILCRKLEIRNWACWSKYLSLISWWPWI